MLTVDNSVMGNELPQRFKDQKYKLHLHFTFYKMALYLKKEKSDEFLNEANYPNFPVVATIDKKYERKLSEVYQVVVQHVKKSILKYFIDNRIQLEIKKIMWFGTVPAMA